MSNDGLTILGKSPNSDRIQFLENLINKAKQLVEENGDSPRETLIEQMCDALSESEYEVCINCSYLNLFSLTFLLFSAIVSISSATMVMFFLKIRKIRQTTRS